MDWMFEDFKTDLDTLNPIVREKALSIAKELIEKKDISAKEALSEGIIRAEEWFYDLEG
ncbi:hypothetical protein R3X28_10135 [Maribacter sp. TH_r10]|jgi:uncharacterized protein YdaT|uniref:Uncharacterized protein n=4 Tax=Flavobacteriaceae TaxID=49546 RepID=A0AA97EKF3_9FLAO|nr:MULTISPECIES: hypothetical protein [Flavobacteriaceae]AOE07011.1 hypothetical protein [uncultured bacterium]MBQ0769923.1 hypothetical protein [Bizionia sp.]MBW4970820.1 hypothetical protein [Croceibacter atlanticus]MDN3491319.1 hypothetical protein [Winogradskyella bathintestinalis]MDT0293703.1 hypothetical protein [Mesonia ostreae]|tara:strand:- start:683 stop:859 length:177 start_codon:yes stop_codon:yes gene_type:complete